MRLWHAARWVGLVLIVLVLAAGLIRLFSGEEHDQPAGPPSPGDYVIRHIVPWFVLGAALLALVAGAVLSSKSSATREALDRNLRFFGAVSIIALVFAGTLVVAVGAALASGACCGPVRISNETLFVLVALLGLAAFLGLVGVHAHGTKKVLEAHYDLKRTAALLQDTVEQLRESLPKAGR
jgi:MFS family permease